MVPLIPEIDLKKPKFEILSQIKIFWQQCKNLLVPTIQYFNSDFTGSVFDQAHFDLGASEILKPNKLFFRNLRHVVGFHLSDLCRKFYRMFDKSFQKLDPDPFVCILIWEASSLHRRR